MTSSTGSVTASLTLSAFGQTIASSGSSTSAYQYGATSGYRTEGDAGLTLVGCRFYDAQVGRFISRDTYLDEAPYAYCDGDPVNAVDPDGHQGIVKKILKKIPTIHADGSGNHIKKTTTTTVIHYGPVPKKNILSSTVTIVVEESVTVGGSAGVGNK